ncbi:unnamed protein product [marine sediment metagenome]|uniref:Uncharacterized protein n=1 Tax=marine sediment metagenome TaxID=412755 RepID=X1T623_9ZZZZ
MINKIQVNPINPIIICATVIIIRKAKTERYKPVIMIEMAAIEIKFIELIIDLTLLSL